MKNINYIILGNSGHQPDFDCLFAKAFEKMGLNVNFTAKTLKIVISPSPLFCSIIDTRPTETINTICAGIFRSLLGHKTIGLLFRPDDCFKKGSIKSYVRRIIFNLASRFRNFHILSIVPFEICPQAAKVSNGWIYDPQLWDLNFLGKDGLNKPQEFEGLLKEKSKGRKLIVALGRQDISKGFGCFVDLWRSSQEIRDKFLFVSAGRVSAECREYASSFVASEGYLIDDRISNAMLLRFYALADAIWCCYSPNYNQSSGIHGRAIQLGVPAVVRQGSFIDSLNNTLKHPSIAIPFDNIKYAQRILIDGALNTSGRNTDATTIIHMQEHSIAAISAALEN